ncbi:MAG: metallophosphoesterase family protein [Fusobacteriaceae bacterium]
MKLLVISDSHGDVGNIIAAYEAEKPDVIICAGDYSEDARQIKKIYKDLEIYIVKGNGDVFDKEDEYDQVIALGELKIFITHGHLYGVKGGYGSLIKKSEEIGVRATFFGHTHRREHFKIGGIDYFNPGALRDGSYGVVEFSEENNNLDNIKFEFKEI